MQCETGMVNEKPGTCSVASSPVLPSGMTPPGSHAALQTLRPAIEPKLWLLSATLRSPLPSEDAPPTPLRVPYRNSP